MTKVFTVSTPTIRIKVANKYLGLSCEGFTEGYLIAVTSIPNSVLMFTVHLETGALWSRLPIEALVCTKYDSNINLQYTSDILQPFSCLEGDIQVIEHPYLKNYTVTIAFNGNYNDIKKGYYLFTIDVLGDGLASDPIQYKTHNIILLENGQLIAYPNNYLLFTDTYFADKIEEWPKYRRTDKQYYSGG